MAERVRVRDLLARARQLYDEPATGLAAAAGRAWRSGFASGADWMRQALGYLRGRALPGSAQHLNRLGLIKYGWAGVAAVLVGGAAFWLGWPWLACLGVLAFYAVEAQMVFLFPLILDGSTHPFRDAHAWTRRAGGTLAVMGMVLPLATLMLLGGFAGRGFVRSWCLGCLAICLWYEQLRTQPAPSPEPVRSLFPLRLGSSGPLLVRVEEVALGLPRPWRLLYASDLHLGHAWTRRVPDQLLAAAQERQPDVILLGGDLVDYRAALPQLQALTRSLAQVAPVHAISGNHDPVTPSPCLRDAIEAGSGFWLPDRAIDGPARVDAIIERTSSARPRILCAHYPSVFPEAVAAGYRLVLAGHLHGGQCVLFTRGQRLYPAAWLQRWHVLRQAHQGATLLVSRGVADTLPIRFNCPREVVLCVIS